METADMKQVSLVIPVLDERESLTPMFEQVKEVLETLDNVDCWEIIFIDDGSTDGSWSEMTALSEKSENVVTVRLRRNFGKATALTAGIQRARYPIIITLDADLQDDPNEIPRFLEKLDEGYDLVSGWKQTRHDPLSKRLPSKLFNLTARAITGVPLNDMNCGFKAYRSEIFETVEVYGELHRYIPALASGMGFKVGEIAIQHHPRRHGKSKYGLERFVRGFIDLLTTVTITRYKQKPGHLFGGVGLAFGSVGFAILAYLASLKVFLGESLGDRPLLMLGVMMAIIGVQFLLFGMLAELLVARTHHSPIEKLVVKTIGGDQKTHNSQSQDT